MSVAGVADVAGELVRRSTEAQGLPVTVTDPQTLARVTAILRAPRGSGTPERDEGAHHGALVIPFALTTTTTNPTAQKGGCRGPA